ncbi:Hsp20/alpha crystallin family protein [Lutispora thermophila]|uniref:Heat shock protein Hsp20 n=1 Tax=Lutispora thermophila DSM 19022 TaxID=1122184 RepID=A0A1M6DQ58_9FIRM|nr:Hsp20/alpha crystallin family protein [Lutispora thermophila]SHI75367.1 heat shock protein Hsp20 [Lutispora thermophila DSM 19022]
MFLIPYGRRNKSLANKSRDIFDIDNLFDDFFNDSFMPAWFMENTQMRVDVKENDREYIVEADLPGVNKENINIELDNDRLTIAVERNEEINVEKENYIRRERRSGSFCRSFYVENVIEDKVTAKFENGVLTIVLPKKEPTPKKRNRIEIK